MDRPLFGGPKGMMQLHMRAGTMDADVIAEMQRDPYHVTEFVQDGDVVLDVGAYIGAFALFVKERCPTARVISLEPMPSNFAALKENAGNQVTVQQVALVGRSGPVTMYDFGPDASACHSIYSLGLEDAKPVEVPGETLENLLRRHGLERLQFLKLDCQGAEFEILPNTPHEILDRIDYIAVEVHRGIAKTGVVLGRVPEHKGKRRRLYAHLLTTHFPICGDIDRDSVQVWTHRRLVPTRRKLLWPLKRACRRLMQGFRKIGSSVRRRLCPSRSVV